MIILSVVYLFFFNGIRAFIFFLFLLMVFYSLEIGGSNLGLLFNLELFRVSLVLLTVLIFLLIAILRVRYRYLFNNVIEYCLIMFFLLLGLVFRFQFEDFFLFYLSFEFSVIPIFFLITG